MRLFLDYYSRTFPVSLSNPGTTVQSVSFKRRDNDEVEVVFATGAVQFALPTGTTGQLGIKRANDYDGEFLAYSDSWTIAGTAQAPVYVFRLNLNTVEINTIFEESADTIDSINAMMEITWTTPDGVVSTSSTLLARVVNDVVTGDEGEPASLPLFYTAETSDFKATQAQAQAGTNNAAWMSPLRVFQAIAAWVAANPIVSTWATLTGKPTTFPPEAHTHPLQNVTQSGATSGQVATWNGTAWVPQTPAAGLGGVVDAPLVVDGGETTTINGWGIQNDFGPTILSFEEAFLQHGNSEVLNWGNNGELSVGSRRLTNLGAPVDANDAVRKIDVSSLVYNGHTFSSSNESTPYIVSVARSQALRVNSYSPLSNDLVLILPRSTDGALPGDVLRIIYNRTGHNRNLIIQQYLPAFPLDYTNTLATLATLTNSGVFGFVAGIDQPLQWQTESSFTGLSVPLMQQVASITGTSNHNLTSNCWHIFTGGLSTGNHTFTLPQNATNGDLVYITFLTESTSGFQVMRFGYEGGSPQAVHSSFETGKTYLFHYNDFDTTRWRKITFG